MGLMEVSPGAEQEIGVSLMRWSAGGAAVPDPIPVADEILFGVVFAIGGGVFLHGLHREQNLNKSRIPLKMQSHPLTSTTGQSPRRKVRKQIRSTSHRTYSRRNKYYRRQTYH
jgi:shikimate kinase